METVFIEFIFTYTNIPQQIWRNHFDVNITEEEFLRQAFTKLGDDGKQLCKISLCQHISKENNPHLKYIEFLLKRNGKYFFNCDINKDDDTKKWSEFKEQYYSS